MPRKIPKSRYDVVVMMMMMMIIIHL